MYLRHSGAVALPAVYLELAAKTTEVDPVLHGAKQEAEKQVSCVNRRGRGDRMERGTRRERGGPWHQAKKKGQKRREVNTIKTSEMFLEKKPDLRDPEKEYQERKLGWGGYIWQFWLEHVRCASSTKEKDLSSEAFFWPWYRVRVSHGEEHGSPRGLDQGLDRPLWGWPNCFLDVIWHMTFFLDIKAIWRVFHSAEKTEWNDFATATEASLSECLSS